MRCGQARTTMRPRPRLQWSGGPRRRSSRNSVVCARCSTSALAWTRCLPCPGCRPTSRSTGSRMPAWRARSPSTCWPLSCGPIDASTGTPRTSCRGSWKPEPLPARERFAVGVLGLGVIGADIAVTLARHGFAVRGHAQSRKIIEGVECRAGDAEFASFLDGLDVLVSVLPDTAATRGRLDRNALQRLAPGAHVVNVGRGTAAGRGRPAGAARCGPSGRGHARRIRNRAPACRSSVLVAARRRHHAACGGRDRTRAGHCPGRGQARALVAW